MKKNMMYMLIGLLMYPALADVTELIDDKFGTAMWVQVGIPSYGLTLGLTERCTDETRRGVSQRDYFDCGKVNIMISDLIYGK